MTLAVAVAVPAATEADRRPDGPRLGIMPQEVVVGTETTVEAVEATVRLPAAAAGALRGLCQLPDHQ